MGQGYADRIGVYEIMVFDDEIREIINKTQDSSIIKKVALKKGMRTVRDSAYAKVRAGITSFEEAERKTQQSWRLNCRRA